jgi:hypothetical protein
MQSEPTTAAEVLERARQVAERRRAMSGGRTNIAPRRMEREPEPDPIIYVPAQRYKHGCPVCSAKTSVVLTRARSGVLRRTRKCSACALRFQTEEMICELTIYPKREKRPTAQNNARWRQMSHAERVELIRSNPNMSLVELAAQYGTSRSAVFAFRSRNAEAIGYTRREGNRRSKTSGITAQNCSQSAKVIEGAEALEQNQTSRRSDGHHRAGSSSTA